jgi:hypothetical protein
VYPQYLRQCAEARQRWAAAETSASDASSTASDSSLSSFSSFSSPATTAFSLPAAPPAVAAVRRTVAALLLQSARVMHPAYLSAHGIRTAPTAMMVAHWIRHAAVGDRMDGRGQRIGHQ